MGKNIIIFSDGTNQKGGVNYNTNVYKLFNMVEDRTDRQMAFYEPGVGTDWSRFIGSITGLGFSKNILDCYRFLFENFKTDDQIYLFGFSRGAATVRSLSGFISLFGILPQSRPDLIREAFKIYTIKDDVKRKTKAEAFIKKHHTMSCKIKFLGVWDTVSALGIPVQKDNLLTDLFRIVKYGINYFFPHRFHSFALSSKVEFARHAISIDENRKIFSPVYWQKLEDGSDSDRMKQVWFSGVHTDVGGGYKEEELSNITLRWMVREACDKGLLLYKKGQPYKDFEQATADANGVMHNEREGFIKKRMYKAAQRTWNVDIHGTLCVHQSVLERKRNTENTEDPNYNPWVLQVEERQVVD